MPSIFARDDNGYTELHRAASIGDCQKCEDLLMNSFDPNARAGKFIKDGPFYKDWYWEPGTTPLLLSIQNGHVECARLLMKLGADAKLYDNYGYGTLHAVSQSKSSELVSDLLKVKVEREHIAFYRTFDESLGWYIVGSPLHACVLQSDIATAQVLLESGVCPNLQLPHCQRTPLHYASAFGEIKLVELLIKFGADKQLKENQVVYGVRQDKTAYEYAEKNNHSALLNIL